MPRTAGPTLVALDIDGTIADDAGTISRGVVAAVRTAQAVGHHVVLATGRSLVGLAPVLRQLDSADGWAVMSNGALLVRVGGGGPVGYRVEAARLFDPCAVVTRAVELVPEVAVGAEEVGSGWRFSRPLPTRPPRGTLRWASLVELRTTPATKVALVAPGIGRFVDVLAATGATVTTVGQDWLDVVGPGVSKAAALEDLRCRLGVPLAATLAVGNGSNDVAMLCWAARSYATADAPSAVRAAASDVCAAVADDGVVDVLRSLDDPARR
ncbi:HAD family hydrolase [Cellulomonas sp. S1-8]|uniref:HAD family hydrolase n=1 Tax=Cellulomonas sp. S1-8 TaxID=2904790 RepID=UPI0022435999|nr:HAD family hydrolase [Cellulomonas sp. S1-8]UZN03411.1 Cof-type HAD-IIB family hydrolase [Cellulomonas sp. S1-8]